MGGGGGGVRYSGKERKNVFLAGWRPRSGRSRREIISLWNVNESGQGAI